MAHSKKSKLLSKKEQELCQHIALSDENLAGKRAKALLALNDGVTRAIAAENSGLTDGQLKYLLSAFTLKRLSIFPEDIFSSLPTPEKETPIEKVKKKTQNASKKGKDKKGKKDKKKLKNKKKDKKKKKDKVKKSKSDKNKKSKKKK